MDTGLLYKCRATYARDYKQPPPLYPCNSTGGPDDPCPLGLPEYASMPVLCGDPCATLPLRPGINIDAFEEDPRPGLTALKCGLTDMAASLRCGLAAAGCELRLSAGSSYLYPVYGVSSPGLPPPPCHWSW